MTTEVQKCEQGPKVEKTISNDYAVLAEPVVFFPALWQAPQQ